MKSIEIFAGAGGMAIGASSAGFTSSLLLDFAKEACLTLKTHTDRKIIKLHDEKIVQSTIEEFDFSDFSDGIDVVIGGPPCQPFSQAGKRENLADKRNMFPQAIRTLSEVKPKAFLFENVKGLATGKNSGFAEFIRLQLRHPEIALNNLHKEFEEQLVTLEDYETSGAGDGLKYNVVMQILNAADFGVPQKRERIFFAGFRSDLGIEWHFPTSTHSKKALFFDQSKLGGYWDRHKVSNDARSIISTDCLEVDSGKSAWLTVRDAIADLPDPEFNAKSAGKIPEHNFVSGAKSYPGHTGSILDLPSKAIKAGVHGVPGGENMLRNANGSVRYFTIRECARLQTFPDQADFSGSWSKKVNQIGNAVPCLLAEKILSSMRLALESSVSNELLATRFK